MRKRRWPTPTACGSRAGRQRAPICAVRSLPRAWSQPTCPRWCRSWARQRQVPRCSTRAAQGLMPLKTCNRHLAGRRAQPAAGARSMALARSWAPAAVGAATGAASGVLGLEASLFGRGATSGAGFPVARRTWAGRCGSGGRSGQGGAAPSCDQPACRPVGRQERNARPGPHGSGDVHCRRAVLCRGRLRAHGQRPQAAAGVTGAGVVRSETGRDTAAAARAAAPGLGADAIRHLPRWHNRHASRA